MKNYMSITLVIIISLIFGIMTPSKVFAFDNECYEDRGSYSIELDDTILDDSSLISEISYIENNRYITEEVYKLSDGTKIIDTMDRSALMLASDSGSDTVTRKRTISSWGTITISATFKWYKDGMFSYVKCSSMSASRSLDSKAQVGTWETSRTKDYVAIGKASAQVKYYFYNKQNPTQHQEGTFKVTCTDTGSISDNG